MLVLVDELLAELECLLLDLDLHLLDGLLVQVEGALDGLVPVVAQDNSQLLEDVGPQKLDLLHVAPEVVLLNEGNLRVLARLGLQVCEVVLAHLLYGAQQALVEILGDQVLVLVVVLDLLVFVDLAQVLGVD